MANVKRHCSGCCPACNNCHAHADCTNGNSCRSRSRHGCGCSSCNHNHSCGCASCNSGYAYQGRSGNGFGTLRSVTGPFSNCGNWWMNDECFPYYTGPCGPCEPCSNCCCKDWPWPFPPMYPVMPVNYSGYAASAGRDCHHTDGCGGCDAGEHYTSHKNSYRTEASAREVFAAGRVKPIVDMGDCGCGCDGD